MEKCYTVTRLGKKDNTESILRVYKQLGDALVCVMANILNERNGQAVISENGCGVMSFEAEDATFTVEEHVLS